MCGSLYGDYPVPCNTACPYAVQSNVNLNKMKCWLHKLYFKLQVRVNNRGSSAYDNASFNAMSSYRVESLTASYSFLTYNFGISGVVIQNVYVSIMLDVNLQTIKDNLFL